ncbi:MAG: hypothetical protein JO001_04375 [Alphaproteobacteria bacterium]|nr:hypothetical protein [Alphaproteobacteria bacterium]
MCGIERGGTSMIAAVLHKLGITMGDNLDATFEDHELANAARDYISLSTQSSQVTLKHAVKTRNQRHAQWGFKIPNIFLNIEIIEFIRDPVLVFVFRDNIAIAERIAASTRRSTADAFDYVANLQGRLAETFARTTRPSLAISYEKAVAKPEEFVRHMAETLSLSMPQEALLAAAEVVRRTPAEYLAVAGPADIIGHVEGFDCGDLVGWAVDLSNETRSVSLTVEIDSILIAEFAAEQLRADLWVYCHANLKHGFRWRVPRTYYDDVNHAVVIRCTSSASTRIANASFDLRIPEIFGSLEEIVDQTLRGWLFWWKGKTQDLYATVEIDDHLIVRASADFPRDDLEPIGFGGAQGLAFEIPPYLFDGKTHQVKMTIDGCQQYHISGSPRFIEFPSTSEIQTDNE